MAGARGLLINITGGDDMTLFEVDQAANRIREEVDEDANIIFGSAIDETLPGKIRVSVVATGIDTPSQKVAERPQLVAVGGAPSVSTAAGANGAPMGIMAAPPVGPRPAAAMTQTRMQPSRPTPAPMPRMVASAPAHAAAAVAVEADYGQAVGDAEEPMEAPASYRPASAQAARPAARPAAQVRANDGFADPGEGNRGEAGPAPARKSLFGIVTGAIRGSLPAAPAGAPAQPVRTEPSLHEGMREGNTRINVRQAASEEMAIDIPAFLRRQSS